MALDESQLELMILTIGLIMAAFLAIDLEEVVYSVLALACALILVALLYVYYGAIYAAIFQLAVGVSTLAILFLSGEMLSESSIRRQPRQRVILSFIIGFLISLPTMFLTVSVEAINQSPQVSFAEEFWNLRSIDAVLQGIVILVIAIGIAIVFHEKKEQMK
jgi:NADH:ubiquinone oxidoreductase subunit 6 (subunit J)